MRNRGITDEICSVLRQGGRAMTPLEIAKQLPIPEGWNFDRLRATVKAILHTEAKSPRERWERVCRGKYVATPILTWVEPGVLIQHLKTGAVVRVRGKMARNGTETFLHRWEVFNPITKRTWVLRGEDIERDWQMATEEDLIFVYKQHLKGLD